MRYLAQLDATMRHLHGQLGVIEREIVAARPCPLCKASIGKRCRKSGPWRAGDRRFPHVERRRPGPAEA